VWDSLRLVQTWQQNVHHGRPAHRKRQRRHGHRRAMDRWAWGWVLFSFLSMRVELFVVCTSRTDSSAGYFHSRIDSSMLFFCPCVLMMLYLHCHCTFATTTHVWIFLKHRWPPFLWGHAWTHDEHVRPIEAATKHRVGGRIRFGGRGAFHVRSWRLKSGYLPPSTLLIPLGFSLFSLQALFERHLGHLSERRRWRYCYYYEWCFDAMILRHVPLQ